LDTVTVQDPKTGRTAELTPPEAGQVGIDLTTLVDLARRWCNLATQESAEAELKGLLGRDALSVLYGLCWTLSAWAVLAEARTGMPADDAIRSLDYQGPWRRSDMPADVWEALNGIVRQGALAQLTRDGRVAAAFEGNVRQLGELPDVILHHSLVLIDGLQQDMQREGLPTWQVANWVTGQPGNA
jgi:hypothetical protein